MQSAAQKSLLGENDFLKSLLEIRDAEIATLGSDLEKRDAIIAHQEARFAALLEQVRLMRHTFYAASSEQSPNQGALFDEAEALAAEPADDETADDVAPTPVASAKPRGKRAPLPAHLPRVDIITN